MYSQISHDSHGACFGHPITKLDALYYTVGTLSTGTGNLNAVTQQCIAYTTGQLVLGIVLTGLVIGGVVGRVLDRP